MENKNHTNIATFFIEIGGMTASKGKEVLQQMQEKLRRMTPSGWDFIIMGTRGEASVKYSTENINFEGQLFTRSEVIDLLNKQKDIINSGGTSHPDF